MITPKVVDIQFLLWKISLLSITFEVIMSFVAISKHKNKKKRIEGLEFQHFILIEGSVMLQNEYIYFILFLNIISLNRSIEF